MLLQRIRFTVIIVSFALAGVFLLQGYWLYNSYQLSAEQFDKDILKLLQTLQQKHIQRDMKTLGIPLDSLRSGKRLIIGKGEKMNAFFQTFSDVTGRQPELPLLEPDDSTKGPFKLSVITQINAGKTDIKGRSKVQQTKIVNITDVFHDKSELQKLSGPLSLEIDSLLHTHNIYTSYALKLSNISGRGQPYYTDSIRFEQFSRKITRLKFGILQPYFVDFSLDNNLLFIVKKMQWILLISIAIIGATAWAFLYMLRTIFQQKKMSDIKNDFFNNMTHEFKTPIATISLAVEALKNREVNSNSQRLSEYLTICQLELNRISSMVDKVLRMAAFEKNEVSLYFQTTNVLLLINKVISTMQPQLSRKNAVIHVNEGQELLPMLELDQDHIANVFYNLIENSLKYSRRLPVIKIDLRYEQAFVKISIEDNGIGIPTAYQDRVFDNFFRVPTGDLHDVKGFGMGLSYVASIVRMHHGEISVSSRLGEGSVFTICLPFK